MYMISDKMKKHMLI